jgi:hypothetical protein
MNIEEEFKKACVQLQFSMSLRFSVRDVVWIGECEDEGVLVGFISTTCPREGRITRDNCGNERMMVKVAPL